MRQRRELTMRARMERRYRRARVRGWPLARTAVARQHKLVRVLGGAMLIFHVVIVVQGSRRERAPL